MVVEPNIYLINASDPRALNTVDGGTDEERIEGESDEVMDLLEDDCCV